MHLALRAHAAGSPVSLSKVCSGETNPSELPLAAEMRQTWRRGWHGFNQSACLNSGPARRGDASTREVASAQRLGCGH